MRARSGIVHRYHSYDFIRGLLITTWDALVHCQNSRVRGSAMPVLISPNNIGLDNPSWVLWSLNRRVCPRFSFAGARRSVELPVVINLIRFSWRKWQLHLVHFVSYLSSRLLQSTYTKALTLDIRAGFFEAVQNRIMWQVYDTSSAI